MVLLLLLTLADAVRTAEAHQPQLRLAHANSDAARARVGQARSYLLPQLAGTGSYQRTTSNFAPRPGFLPTSVNMMLPTAPTFETFNYYNFGLTLTQFLWDFRAPFAFGASRATAESIADTERNVRQQVFLSVRTAYFNARALKALAEVARDNLANQRRHHTQIQGFVEVGTRPEIDMAQADTDVANAQVQSITADNNYQLAKVQLNQAMGVEGFPDFDVADEWLPPVEGEDQPAQELFLEAARVRPDLASADKQVRAQKSTLSAAYGGYGPSLSASMTLTDAGPDITALAWNWNVMVSASWTLFDGLLTYSIVKEAKANLRGIEAQRDSVRQQALLEVSQARLQVRATRATLAAADKAVVSSRLQLTLAEGRYQEGVGNVIELGDAQLAATQAAAQQIQARYNLSIARAQLLKALGRF
jgi:outer membrane protein